MATTGYIPIRDEAGIRSLSTNERDFIRACALRGSSSSQHNRDGDQQSPSSSLTLRTDGRVANQVRPSKLNLTRWENGCSAEVLWGGTASGSTTRVTCQCRADLIPPPLPDRPGEGALSIQVDLSPSASTAFRLAAPVTAGSAAPGGGGGGSSSLPPITDTHQKLLTNRIARCLERILLQGGAIDVEALCVTPGQWVWRLVLSVTVIDSSGGNLLDAAVFATMAALRHYRKPHVQMMSPANDDDGGGEVRMQQQQQQPTNTNAMPTLIPSQVREATPLPLHHTPVSISFALIPAADSAAVAGNSSSGSGTAQNMVVAALMDPNAREELCQTGTLTVAMNIHGEICLVDYGGGCELPPQTLRECCRVARSATQQACTSLERSLQNADDRAITERLERLRANRLQQQYDARALTSTNGIDTNEDLMEGIPYYQSADAARGDDFMEVDSAAVDADAGAQQQLRDEAEEAYRRQALDYNIGHMPTKVRENAPDTDGNQGSRKNAKGAAASNNTTSSSALLAAMLRSVHRQEADSSGGHGVDGGEEHHSNQGDDVRQKEKEEVTVAPMEEEERKEKSLNIAQQKQQTKKQDGEDQKTTKAAATSSHLYQDSSDEEDVTMELQSEFSAGGANATTITKDKEAPPPLKEDDNNDDDDDDVDDLTAAIISKKKKGKKKSKKSKK